MVEGAFESADNTTAGIGVGEHGEVRYTIAVDIAVTIKEVGWIRFTDIVRLAADEVQTT